MATATLDRRAKLDEAGRLDQEGKIQGAIDAYRKLVESDPRDWRSANSLGDLLVKARLVDEAVAEYVELAERLAAEGHVARATAVYKKVFRLRPTNADVVRRIAELDHQRLQKTEDGGLLRRVLDAARADPSALHTPALMIAAGPLLPVAVTAPEPGIVPAAEATPLPDAAADNITPAAPIAVSIEAVPPPEHDVTPLSDETPQATDGQVPSPTPLAPGQPAILPASPDESSPHDHDQAVTDSPAALVEIETPDLAWDSIDLKGGVDKAFGVWRDRWIEAAASMAESSMEVGMQLAEGGDWRQAVMRFEQAALAPHLRHEAARCLAHAHLTMGAPEEAVRSLDWAARVPAQSPAIARALAYDVAVAFEAARQPALALAVLRELRSDVGPYFLDVDDRIVRLAADEFCGNGEVAS